METTKRFNLISIKNGQLKCHIEVYNEQNDDSYETVYHNESPINEEFALAMQSLNFHVEKITGTCFPHMVVDGYYRQPSGNSELLTIYVHLENAEASKSTLAVRLHLGKDEYAWIDRLLEDLSLCEREALLYISKGKRLGMSKFVGLA